MQAKLAEAIANGLPEGAAEEGLDNQQAGGGEGFGQGSFEEMLSALEDLTETGATDQARQLLSDITNLLENLEFQQGNGSGSDGFALPSEGEESDQDSDEQQELAEQLEDLSEALREQRELNDDTLEAQRRELDRQREQAQNGGEQEGGEQQGGEQGGEQEGGEQQGGEQQGGQSGSQSGSQGNQFGAGEEAGGLTREELAERQAQIGELLQQLAEGGEGQAGGGDEEGEGEAGGGDEEGEGQTGGGDAGDEEGIGGISEEDLDDVLRAQRFAERALEDGDFGLAQRSQERITEGLRELAAELSGQLDELGTEEGGEGPTTDPFGNQINQGGGLAGSDDVLVPEKSERQRALEILEELRRRYDEATDPAEREYLKRLLDRF